MANGNFNSEKNGFIYFLKMYHRFTTMIVYVNLSYQLSIVDFILVFIY